MEMKTFRLFLRDKMALAMISKSVIFIYATVS